MMQASLPRCLQSPHTNGNQMKVSIPRVSVSTAGSRPGSICSVPSRGAVYGMGSVHRCSTALNAAAVEAPPAGRSAGTEGGIPPAVLPGTPSSFPIPSEELISLAQKVFLEENSGVDNPSRLASNFRFEFPVVSLDAKSYLKALGSFNLKGAFPDMTTHTYDWRVDKFEPNRVWWTVRMTATHTGPLSFAGKVIEPTGKVVYGAPETLSYTFNEEGKVTSFTGGYVIDRRVGNTDGLGAVFGILSAIGHPLPKAGTLKWAVSQFVAKILAFVSGLTGK